MHEETPLSPAVRRLLEASIRIEHMEDAALSEELFLSIHTVRTEFKQAFERTGTHSREQLLIRALKRRWVAIPSED